MIGPDPSRFFQQVAARFISRRLKLPMSGDLAPSPGSKFEFACGGSAGTVTWSPIGAGILIRAASAPSCAIVAVTILTPLLPIELKLGPRVGFEPVAIGHLNLGHGGRVHRLSRFDDLGLR